MSFLSGCTLHYQSLICCGVVPTPLGCSPMRTLPRSCTAPSLVPVKLLRIPLTNSILSGKKSLLWNKEWSRDKGMIKMRILLWILFWSPSFSYLWTRYDLPVFESLHKFISATNGAYSMTRTPKLRDFSRWKSAVPTSYGWWPMALKEVLVVGYLD